jgi:hypothetical protein
MQTLWSIQNIALNISQDEHKKILEEIQKIAGKKEDELDFPLDPGLHNQTPPEVHFVGWEGMLDTITGW